MPCPCGICDDSFPGFVVAKKLHKPLFSFTFVGGIGFMADASVLTLLVNGLNWGPYRARLCSFAVAVTLTWYLNRHWTFASQARNNKKIEYARYLTVQSIGALLNLGIYSICLETFPVMVTYPVLALAIGSWHRPVFQFLCVQVFRLQTRAGHFLIRHTRKNYNSSG